LDGLDFLDFISHLFACRIHPVHPYGRNATVRHGSRRTSFPAALVAIASRIVWTAGNHRQNSAEEDYAWSDKKRNNFKLTHYRIFRPLAVFPPSPYASQSVWMN
jgi:hypothetical protein